MLNIVKKIRKSFHDQAIKLKWSEKIKYYDDVDYKELIEFGILKFRVNFVDFAEYLNINYIQNIISNYFEKIILCIKFLVPMRG